MQTGDIFVRCMSARPKALSAVELVAAGVQKGASPVHVGESATVKRLTALLDQKQGRAVTATNILQTLVVLPEPLVR